MSTIMAESPDRIRLILELEERERRAIRIAGTLRKKKPSEIVVMLLNGEFPNGLKRELQLADEAIAREEQEMQADQKPQSRNKKSSS